MMHPKMLRRILAVASETLTLDDRYGFFVYFEALKKNEKAPQDKRRTIEELLILALSTYLPQRWWRILRHRARDVRGSKLNKLGFNLENSVSTAAGKCSGA